MSIKEILTAIIARIDVKHKWQRNFILELFELIYSIQGRVTFVNLARYSKLNESTFRRNYKKFFDWLSFNWELMQFGGLDFSNPIIGAIDCSYLPKAGKSTYGLDRFFNSVVGRARKGLEISLLSLIDTYSGTAWALDVRQTPAGLSAKEGDTNSYTRVDFYMQQLKQLQAYLFGIQYLVADGYYAKVKVFETMYSIGKALITKLRPDANLRYLYDGPPTKGRGRKKQFDGKVNWKNLSQEIDRWEYVGLDEKYPHLEISTCILNSPQFKRNFRVVILHNLRTKRYVVLACTDINLDARSIVKFYQSRFKIEFLFRDAKQFCGLTHCQARNQEALHFHFNMSLAAVNLLQVQMKLDSTITSMNSFVRKAYNTRLVNWLFSQLSSKAEFDLNHPEVKSVLSFGCLYN